ncbi:single-stranded DNA-binding protein [Caldisericum sp.]|uniref:single-stranded DNA-binding protein n=1 Tax=Caldisericum sp. TaxID=2499687 RepID=UPI003D0EA2B4
MFNKVLLIGRAYQVETRYTDEGLAILTMRLATWDSPQVQYHRIVYFDPTGERAYKYSEILNDSKFNGYLLIEGQLRYRIYTAKDGTKRRITEVVAKTIKILSPREKEEKVEQIEREKEKIRETEQMKETRETKEAKETKETKETAKTLITEDIIEEELIELNDTDIPF